MSAQLYYATGYDGPLGPTSTRPPISSIRVTESPSHWRIEVWNRGGKAGELVVGAEDGQTVVDRLLPPKARRTA